jgi:hypothetical protein
MQKMRRRGVATLGEDNRGRSAALRGPLIPFILGVAVGGIAGAVVGTLLSQHTTHLIAALAATIDRRLHDSERERLRLELMLQ